MNNEDERRRAGMMVSNLLGRQHDMTPAADPLAMMRELTDTLKRDSEPPEYKNFQDNLINKLENSAIANMGGVA